MAEWRLYEDEEVPYYEVILTIDKDNLGDVNAELGMEEDLNRTLNVIKALKEGD